MRIKIRQNPACCGVLIIIIFVFLADISNFFKSDNIKILYQEKQQFYLINTTTCNIPDSNPFHKEVIKFFHPEPYIPCNSYGNYLSYINKSSNVVSLHINESLLSSYSLFDIKCCFSSVTRSIHSNNVDNEISFSECIPFEKNVIIPESSLIRVQCSSLFGLVYSNVHAIIRPKELAKSKIPEISVIFVGIDSVSKFNLQRTMPKTFAYLEGSNFINLKGYTKVEDNTFPNLMAILSGRTYQQIHKICKPQQQTFDDCYIIWNEFKKMGYTTAFAEDETAMSTFNNVYKGFKKSPTDYYFRPYLLAAEQLPSMRRHFMHYCTGPENTGERIMNLVKDFVTTLKSNKKFGFFWMNSFSHEYINAPSSMDDKIFEFLTEIHPHLKNTIFVFFSDHGFRFGKIRQTYTGWLEERTPFIYVYLPDIIKSNYPKAYKNFHINSKRLTNPFDIYMTLQNVLHWTNSSYVIQPSMGCPKCLSLFTEVSERRTCNDAAIADHWCLCSGYQHSTTTSEVVQRAVAFIIDNINTLVQSFSEGYKCARFHLRKIAYAAETKRVVNGDGNVNYNMRVLIKTRPAAVFEATVKVLGDGNRFELVGNISRVNKYRSSTTCLQKGILQKYCYCDGLFTPLKSAICYFIDCV